MGGRSSKPKERIYASDSASTAELACKSLEEKLSRDYKNVIVGLADDTTANMMGTLFSPRGTLNLFALARVNDQDYRVTIARVEVNTDDPYIKGHLDEQIVASVCIR